LGNNLAGYLVMGANHRDEVCLVYQVGNLRLDKATMVRCSNLVLARAKTIVETLSRAVADSQAVAK
jgi:hypothetical protein